MKILILILSIALISRAWPQYKKKSSITTDEDYQPIRLKDYKTNQLDTGNVHT